MTLDLTYREALDQAAAQAPTGRCSAGSCTNAAVCSVWKEGDEFVIRPGARFCMACAEGLAVSEPA